MACNFIFLQNLSIAFFDKKHATEKIFNTSKLNPVNLVICQNNYTPANFKNYPKAIAAGLVSSFSANLIKKIYKTPDYMSTPISLSLGIFMIALSYKAFENRPDASQMLVTILTALCSEVFLWDKLLNDKERQSK